MLVEEWRTYVNPDLSDADQYSFSNYGRVKSFRANPKGKLLKGSFVRDYMIVPFRDLEGKRKAIYLHKILAEIFLDNPESKEFVIHLDHNHRNNRIDNLQWANMEEKRLHRKTNPRIQEKLGRITNSHLTEEKVRLLKQKLADPNRKTRIKMLAKRFGISEMQLHRIRKGENWGHVTID